MLGGPLRIHMLICTSGPSVVFPSCHLTSTVQPISDTRLVRLPAWSVRLKVTYRDAPPVWPRPQPGRQTQSGSLAPQASLLAPGQAFCFCGIAVARAPGRPQLAAAARYYHTDRTQAARTVHSRVEGIGGGALGQEGGGVRPWSRQVGFDKADKGNLHASGDIVLGVDLECNQRLPVARQPAPARTSFLIPLVSTQRLL